MTLKISFNIFKCIKLKKMDRIIIRCLILYCFRIYFHILAMISQPGSFVLNFCLIIVAQFRVLALSDHSREFSNVHAESKHERTFSNYFALTRTNSYKFESWPIFVWITRFILPPTHPGIV